MRSSPLHLLSSRRLGLLRRVLQTVTLLLFASSAAQAAESAGTAFCEKLLPVTELRALLGSKAGSVERSVRGPVKESDRQCSRIFALPPFDRFSDELILLVTPLRGATTASAARQQLDSMARNAGKVFGLSQPGGIGDAAVHFRRPDPLSDSRMEFNVSFIRGAHLVELKYQSVDDGKQNKFIYESVELEALAKAIASRL